MARVLHTADTHLGYRQYHRKERQKDFNDAFSQIIQAAISKDVDAVIHAGDLFHDSRPNADTFLTVVTELRTLKANNIPFLLVVGNHDDTRNSQWADILQRMDLAQRLGSEPTIIDDTAFYGIDYVPATRRAQLDYQYPDHNADYAALVAHGGFEPLSIHDDWNAEHIIGTSNITFDALLLGDDHTPKTDTIKNTLATYPGSTERTAHDQRAPRQYNLIEFGGFTDGVTIDEIELDTRPFIYIDKTELDADDTAREIRDAIDNAPTDDAVVIITIDGDGEPFTNIGDIEEYATDQGALVANARDQRSITGTGHDVEVSFADPDNAVEERIRELDLTVAGADLDHTVRDLNGIPDSNLSDEIKTQIDDRVDDNPDDFTDPADFDPIETPDENNTDDDADTDTDEVDDEDGGTTTPETNGSTPTADNSTTPTDDTDTDSDAADSDDDTTPPDQEAGEQSLDASTTESQSEHSSQSDTNTHSTTTSDPEETNNATLLDY